MKASSRIALPNRLHCFVLSYVLARSPNWAGRSSKTGSQIYEFKLNHNDAMCILKVDVGTRQSHINMLFHELVIAVISHVDDPKAVARTNTNKHTHTLSHSHARACIHTVDVINRSCGTMCELLEEERRSTIVRRCRVETR